MDQPLPSKVLTDVAMGHVAARCLQVIAQFGIADELEDRPVLARELAMRTNTDADALGRMLRLLAAHGVFVSTEEGFMHNEASRLLRSGHAQSLRPFARMLGTPAVCDGLNDLQHTVRTGKPQRDWQALLSHFAAHPDEASLFNEAMVSKSAAVIPAVLENYDFRGFSRIADVGGGRAHLVRAILDRFPEVCGTLFELPQVIADLADIASPRLKLVAGDFFKDDLPVADCYLLMEVLHDWDDAHASAILAAVRRVAPRHARVLIIETLVSDDPGPGYGKSIDVMMLAVTGGRERSVAKFESLLAAQKFRVKRVFDTTSVYSIVEVVVA